jgi:tetratricopeptide (TPR) repeat protein
MTADDWQRLQPLLGKALAKSPEERASYVEEVKRADRLLGYQIESLLRSHEYQTLSIFRLENIVADEVPLFSIGEVVLGRFTIISLIGTGGMGDIYEANDKATGRVALKTIRPDLANDERVLSLFRQEVQFAQRISSPHVCRIHDLHIIPGSAGTADSAFLTMELLKGVTLTRRIADLGALHWREAERIALQLCSGLSAVHEAGIVHRDVKSSNIMLSLRNGLPNAVLMDFGLAIESVLDGPDASTKTVSGGIEGTTEYMAPEQFEGRRHLTPAADIYAMGVVLYEMVTGIRLFKGSSHLEIAVLRAKRRQPASSIQSGVPHRWDIVIDKCLAFEPEQRFQSAIELAAALRRPSSAASLRALIGDRHSRRRLGLVVACFVLLAAAFLGLEWYRVSTAHQVPEAAQTFYREATEAFHNGNYLTATRQLQEAVKLDPDFALAHARLADAFNELDSTGEAQREAIQIKEELVSQLPSSQRIYVHAVRETVRQDPNAAVDDYARLLDSAKSPAERANALVDLGRANERAGEVGDALKHYSEAIVIDPYSPTPFLRKGILESRQGRQKEADADFARADTIYATNINLEGTAEVNYQRSYVASKLGPGHEKEAREFFQESLKAAEQMRVAALRARALSRLSAIELGAGHFEEAGRVASDAIRLADENGVAYWATDARLRLGNSWIYRDSKEAGSILERARDEAQRNQWPRLLALSQLSLAALAERQQTRQSQQYMIDLASRAYDYYRVFGFAQESFQCQVLLSRAKSFFGSFTESLQHARTALQLANILASPIALLQAHEAIGSMLISNEEYRSALDDLTSAVHIAEEMPAALRVRYLSVEALLRAEALGRLGYIDDARLAVAAVPESAWKTDSQAGFGYTRLQAILLRTQGRYKEELGIAQKALREGADSSNAAGDFQLMVVEGLTHTGNVARAVTLCDELLGQAGEQSPVVVAELKLAKARALLELRQWQTVRTLAQEAGQFFHASGQQESELVSLWVAARSYRGAGSPVEANAAVRNIQDILSTFRNDYGAEDYKRLVRRAEMAEVVPDEHQEEIQ